jgi:hypothetical protein
MERTRYDALCTHCDANGTITKFDRRQLWRLSSLDSSGIELTRYIEHGACKLVVGLAVMKLETIDRQRTFAFTYAGRSTAFCLTHKITYSTKLHPAWMRFSEC